MSYDKGTLQVYLDFAIPSSGYLYTYVANESNVSTATSVYFDDFNIIHTRATSTLQVVQTTDYYPFGLAINPLSYQKQSSLDNDYLYNGKELQDEHNLGWMDYGARMYMPEIGRWGVIDPATESYEGLTPYHYVRNNPVNLFDINGMYDQDLIDQWEKEDLEENGFNYDATRSKETAKIDNEGNEVYESDIAASFTGSDYGGTDYSQSVDNIEITANYEEQKTRQYKDGLQISSYTANYTLNEHIISSWKNKSGQSIGIVSTYMESQHSALFTTAGMPIFSDQSALEKFSPKEGIYTNQLITAPAIAKVTTKQIPFSGWTKTWSSYQNIGQRTVLPEGFNKIRSAVLYLNSEINTDGWRMWRLFKHLNTPDQEKKRRLDPDTKTRHH